ncbi:AAA family ATPase [Litoribaculum gwangyangense]|uniref:AAA+ ATPase domain-containing protein n=1 Tax=Litoribaculum gwangyangense TaxID=1130722 RepID=A0ABP9CWR7_9FLAO
MKTLKEVIQDCQLSFSEITEDYKIDYDQIFNREKDWLNNVEEKTFRLSENVRDDIEYVITKLKEDRYRFKESDTDKLSLFISQINGIIRIANRINNFKEGTTLDNSQTLKLFELFNTIKATKQFIDFDFTLNKNLKSFIVHLFSVVKHCQSPDTYPIYYKYWKNILGEVLKKDDDYDSLCSFYQTIPSPKHLSLGTYFGALGTVLARKISENQIIKEEDDKNYKYIRNKILNIHYFDIITGYKRKPNYYLIGSKYGENNDVDVFPKMLENNVVSVGFASHLDLGDFYLTDDAEIVEYLKEENEVRNSYNALKLFLNIKVGDKVAIKASGSPKGKKGFLSIVGIFEVVQNKDGEVYSHDPDGLGHTLNVKVVDAPIYKEFELGGYGSTVHKLSKQDHINQIFNQTNKKRSLFLETKDKFENSIFENYIKFLRKINSELGLMPNDERVVYSVRDSRLNFTVGQRYSFNLYLNDSRGVYGVISKEKLLDSSEPYDGNPPQPFYNYYTDFEPSNKDWDSITEAIKDELNRTTKSGFIRHHNSEFENYVFELSKETIMNNDNMKLSLNTILYGPPGTGKTHILKNQFMDMFTTSESSITRQDFLKDIIQNCSWWQVIALAVLELGKTKVADIFNHEYVQVKAQLSNSTTVTPTIWGQLQSHTVEDCEHVKVARRMPPMIFNKTEKSEWEILQNEVEEQSPELLELKLKIENFESVPNKRIERFEFLTFHQSYSYEDFIEGIKPELSESDVSYKIEEGVFQKMCNRARNDSSNNYAIFIDEINRGNISSIFGELITLIEDDKREGKPNEIKATLPYSKKHFSVPNNLYIIGTMNTADRSVEALDTALRRRFSFIEMNPEPEKLNTDEFKCIGIDLEALLNAINARIEKLLDKDYCIGHSYFMTITNRKEPLKEMKTIFQNKILPLLQEYFYGDWGKILLVIGKEFVETKKNTIKFLSTDSYEDFEEYDEKPIYNFTNPTSWTLDSFKSIYE